MKIIINRYPIFRIISFRDILISVNRVRLTVFIRLFSPFKVNGYINTIS